MAAQTIKEFLVGIGFQVDDSKLNNLSSNLKNFAKGAGAAIAGVAGSFYLIKKAVGDTANKFNALGDAASRIGTDAAALEKLGYIAENTGSSAQKLQDSLQNLAVKVGEATRGSGEGVQVFEALGIAAAGADGQARDAADVFAEFGAKIKDLSRSEQLDFANKLGLDKTTLGMLTSDTAELGAEFDKLYSAAGFGIGGLAKKSTAWNDALRRLGYAFDTLKFAIVDGFLGDLTESAETVRKSFTDFLASLLKVLRPFANAFGRVFKGVVLVLTLFAKVALTIFKAIVNPFVDFFGMMPKWAKVALGLAVAVKGLFALFAASPIGFVIALASAIALLVDDFLMWKKGGQSFIDWAVWEPAITAATDAIQNIVGFLRNLTSAVFAVVGAFAKLFSGDFGGFFGDMRVAIDSVIKSFENLFGLAVKTKDFLGGVVGGAASWAKSALNAAGVTAFDEYLPASNSGILAQNKTANNNVTVKNNINISGVSSPEKAANMVANAQNRTYNDAVRYGGGL